MRLTQPDPLTNDCSMKLKDILKQRFVILVVCILSLGMSHFLSTPSGGIPVQGIHIGPQDAAAASRYGIVGQTAPELNLSGWIDGNGNPMAPVHLADYRGRVVYLYFFQDW